MEYFKHILPQFPTSLMKFEYVDSRANNTVAMQTQSLRPFRSGSYKGLGRKGRITQSRREYRNQLRAGLIDA